MESKDKAKTEMPVNEWLIRMPCAFLSLSIAFASLCGILYSTMAGVNATNSPLILVAIWTGAIGMIWGVPAMAKWINKQMVSGLSTLFNRI